MIKGYVTASVNVRNKPDEKLSGITLIGSISPNGSFEGSTIVNDGLGKKWIKLSRINGILISDSRYIAAYLSTVKYEVVPDEIPPVIEDLGVPDRITTIEEFTLEDGSIKKRTIVWNNPQVTEE